MSSATQRGFTIIEVIVVVALMAMISGFSAPFLSGAVPRQDVEMAASGVVDAVREAQAATFTGRNDARYGVHFQGDRYVFFQGSTYVVADANNAEHVLPQGLIFSSVVFSPGGACTLPAGTGNCDAKFQDRRGTPTVTGTAVITSDAGESKTVYLNAAGMVYVAD